MAKTLDRKKELAQLSPSELAALSAAVLLFKQQFGNPSSRPAWVASEVTKNGQVVALDDRGLESLRNTINQEFDRQSHNRDNGDRQKAA